MFLRVLTIQCLSILIWLVPFLLKSFSIKTIVGFTASQYSDRHTPVYNINVEDAEVSSASAPSALTRSSVFRIPVEDCRDNVQYNLTDTTDQIYMTELTNTTILAPVKRRTCVVQITVPVGHFIQFSVLNNEQINFVGYNIVNDTRTSIFHFSYFYAYSRILQSTSNKVHVEISLSNKLPEPYRPWYRLLYVARPEAGRTVLPIVFTSLKSGYVTSPEYDGKTAYPSNIYASRDLHIPVGHVVMISFPYFDLDVESRDTCGAPYKDTLFVYELGNVTDTLLFERCGSTSIPTQVYTKSLRFRFRAWLFGGNLGFKMLFTFHPEHQAPSTLASGLFDCSVSHYASFKQHVHCNLEPECQGGEDERDCPFHHPGCNGSLGYQNSCFKYVTWHEQLNWDQANAACYNNGGRLVSLGTREKSESFHKLFVYGKRRGAVYVGGSTVEDYTVPLIYRNVWQWRDRTMAYNINVSLYWQVYHRACMTYHPTISSTLFFPVVCHEKFYTSFVCEHILRRVSTYDQFRTTGIIIPIPPLTNVPAVHISSCPDRHVTHVFLSCDPASRCGVDVYLTTCSVPGQGVMVKFVCNNSRETLPFTLVCDFRQDCADGSDEDFCRHSACMERTCINGQCVAESQWCDNVWHCVDGSDELDCLMNRFLLLSRKEYLQMPAPALVDLDGLGGYTVNPLSDQTSCPPTHFQCPSSYCLPVYVRCNGVYDCPGHEDEWGCQQYTCPNFYRCRASNVCVHPNHMCDGVFQCPQQDDEWMCSRNLTCPEGCHCQGLAFACTSRFLAELYSDLRYLDARGSGMTVQDLTNNFYLVHLGLSANNLSEIPDLSLPNLLFLDLSHNEFRTINVQLFISLRNLRVLSLAGNPLSDIVIARFGEFQHSLHELDLSLTFLKEVSGEMFSAFTALQTLNLSHCRIQSIGRSGFRLTPNLSVLDLRGNTIHRFPDQLFLGVAHLTSVTADNYRLCCKTTLPDYFDSRMCSAPHDALSSCEDLLRSEVHRVWLWVMSLVSAVGNAACVVCRFWLQDDLVNTGFGLMITNLNMVNFVMSAPLAVLVVADLVFRDRYLAYEDSWRMSVGCRSAGILAVMSSVVPALTILLLTVDRLTALLVSINRFGKWSVMVCLCTVWVLGIVTASIPHFQESSNVIRVKGLCFPVPLITADTDYSVSIINGVPFLHILVFLGQLLIYRSVRGDIIMSDTSQRTRDRIFARRLMYVAVSDSLCWLVAGLLTLLGVHGVNIADEVNVGMAIFVLPLNSALNPLLYTFSMLMEKRRLTIEGRLLHWLQSRARHTDKTGTHLSKESEQTVVGPSRDPHSQQTGLHLDKPLSVQDEPEHPLADQ